MSRPATIKDVAEHAGVSIKTVSRVINREATVRLSTAERVNESIANLRYVPNTSARGLAGRKSYMVGVLYDNPSSAYVLDVQAGVLSVCEKEGYNVLIHPCDYQSASIADEVADLVRRGRVDGLVLTPPLSDLPILLDALTLDNTPYVGLSSRSKNGAYCVNTNEYDTSIEITRYLISLGHRKIGFIKGHSDHIASQWRFEGFCHAMNDANIPIQKIWVQSGDFSFESGEYAARHLLERSKDKPTAIFASNDYMAAAVLKTAHQLGLVVPQDLSIVGFDDAPVAAQLWPPLTTIRQPVRVVAAKAAQLLIGQLRGGSVKEVKYSHDVYSCELVIRGSTSVVPVG